MRLPEEFQARFELREVLGRGASGEVYLALHRALQREVVAKVIPVSPDNPFRARVLQEARILVRLSHPCIVPLLDFGEHEDMLYLVYPYELGRSLEDCRAAGLVPNLEATLEILQGTLEGLAHLHDQGVVHRDLKPANILCLDEGGIRIIDFGLAKALFDDRGLTDTHVFLGTPRYAAPAQCLGEDVEPRDDLYALGLIGYELLAGSSPIVADRVDQIFDWHLHRRPRHLREVRPELPSRLVGLVMDLLEKEREDRPESARAALAMLGELAPPPGTRTATRDLVLERSRLDAPRAVLAEEPSPPKRGAGPARLPRPGRRMLAAVLGMLSLGLSLAWILGRPDPRPTEVRFDVVGDALLVRFRGGRDVRLEVEGLSVDAARPQASPGLLVLRDLPREGVRQVRLRWEGGAGEVHEVTAGPTAIDGPPEPLEGEGLGLRVARPVRARWAGQQAWRSLSPTAPGLPAPPSWVPPLVLEWEEEGLRFLHRFDAAALLEPGVLATEGALARLDPPRYRVALGEAPDPGRAAAEYARTRALTVRALPWLVAGLESETPRALRRRAWALLQELQLLAAVERAAGVAPVGAEQLATAPGSPRPEPATPAGGHTEEPVLEADQGAYLKGRRAWSLAADRARGSRTIEMLQDWRYAQSARVLRFRWPAGAPAGWLDLEVWVDGFVPDSVLVFQEEAPDGSGFGARLWGLPPAPVEKPYLTGDVRLRIPAGLAPAPGAVVAVTLGPLFEERVPYVFFRSVQVHWPASDVPGHGG